MRSASSSFLSEVGEYVGGRRQRQQGLAALCHAARKGEDFRQFETTRTARVVSERRLLGCAVQQARRVTAYAAFRTGKEGSHSGRSCWPTTSSIRLTM